MFDSWWQWISRHIRFYKYFILQFIDIWSCFVLLVKRANKLNSGNHGSALQREWCELTKVTHIYQLISFLFKCLECFLLPIREKLLTESQPDIAFMARSKQEICKPYSDVSECIGINCCSLPVPALNYIESNKTRLVTWWYRDITATNVSGESIMTRFNWTVFKKKIKYKWTFLCQFSHGYSKT